MNELKESMGPLALDELEALMGDCVGCKAPLWDTLEAKARKDLLDATNFFRRKFGINPALYRMCEPCQVRVERKKSIDEKAIKLKELKDRGLIRGDLVPYATPWEDARKANPYAWTVGDDYSPDKGGLFIWGPEGVGKTALARYILTRELSHHSSVAEVSGVDLDWRLRSKKRTDLEWWNQIMNTRVLVLDDLSAVPMDEAVVRKLYSLAESRATEKRPTIVTSNLSPERLHDFISGGDPKIEHMAAPILRRLKPILEVKMTGESLRKSMAYNDAQKGTRT